MKPLPSYDERTRGFRVYAKEADRLRTIADGRRRIADDATANAGVAENAIRRSREDALNDVAQRNRRLASANEDWNQRRALCISLAIGLLAIAAGIGLVALTGSRRRDETAPGSAAARTAMTLGLSVASYLALLEIALWRSDTLRVSWGPGASAMVGVLALICGTAIGWRKPSALLPPSESRRALIGGLMIAATAIVPAAAIATTTRPEGAKLSQETLRLAAEGHADAPMPVAVQRDRRRAAHLSEAASTTLLDARRAENALEQTTTTNTNAVRRSHRAERSVKYWRVVVRSTQASYDSYQKLLAPIRIRTPSYVPPDIGAPTTQNFGDGTGTVGACADGTLSDSIGKSGACSHHGGVG